MGNNQLLPFERNRYYVGKLLTSADFHAEQLYGRNKRRFLNEMMFGSGIVCGLGLYSLDDLSIMVDSGVAVDGNGQEIALDAPVVRKLSAVEGFEQLRTNRAVLCLRYEEEDVHPVYTVRGQEQGEEYECNRIRESWQLFLQDREAEEAEPLQSEFLVSETLYADDDYIVTATMPAQSVCGASVRLDLTLRRLNDRAAPFSLTAAIQTPAFTTKDGHVLKIEWKELTPQEPLTFHHHLVAQSLPAPESTLLMDEQSIQVLVGGENRGVTGRFSLRSVVVDTTVEELVDQAVASVSLESRSLAVAQDYVVLGEIELQRTRNSYLIEEISTLGVRRYIRTPATAALRQELSEWFQEEMVSAAAPEANFEPTKLQERYETPRYATGTCDIPLGASMRRGQIAYSNEIVHGLGTGTVFVSVGPEYLADDIKLGTAARNTIFGNASLFANEQPPVATAETAVKVMHDRGSFVVAARLLEDSNQVVLPLRWVAVAMPGSEESKIEKLSGKSIAAVQPTVVMATRSSHFVNVRFNNMEPCTLSYELTEKDSGTITSEGIYTAPGREGVFEIRISCSEHPLICTYAYVVVKKQDVQE